MQRALDGRLTSLSWWSKSMSAHSLLGDIVMALGAAVCVGLPLAVAIIWICS
jgi:hypothetical protein